MVDGLDVLFRIALAILRNNEEELLRCESIPSIYVALESLPNRMWRSDKLLKVRPHSISDGQLLIILLDRSRVALRPFTYRHCETPECSR